MVIITSDPMRRRVERLLEGDVRQEDLNRLFFDMREESGGKGLVSEIGHFLAHSNLRTKGLVADELQNFFTFAKFRIKVAESRIIWTALPPNMPDALRANLKRMRKETLKSAAATNPTHAKRVLERILKRMPPTGFGSLKKPELLNEEEQRIMLLARTLQHHPRAPRAHFG